MPSEPIIELRKVRGVGDVLNDTFRLLRQNYETVGKSLLFIVGPVAVLSSVSGAMVQFVGFTFSPDVGSQAGVPTSALALVLMVLLAVVFGITAGVLAVAVVNGLVMLYQERGPGGFDVRDVWVAAKAHFWKTLGVFMLMFFLFVGLLVLVFIPCLGAFAFLAGTLYLSVLFLVLFPMLVREQIGIFDGMRRCRYLVKGFWWPSLGVLVVAAIIYMLMGTVFSVPYYVALVVSGLHMLEADGGGAAYGLVLVLTNIIGSLGGVLLYSIPLTAMSVQYFNLVERKERVGLLARIDALAAEEDGAAPPPWSPARGFDAAAEEDV